MGRGATKHGSLGRSSWYSDQSNPVCRRSNLGAEPTKQPSTRRLPTTSFGLLFSRNPGNTGCRRRSKVTVFLLGWAGVSSGWSGVGVGVRLKTIFPSTGADHCCVCAFYSFGICTQVRALKMHRGLTLNLRAPGRRQVPAFATEMNKLKM
jgi:hypothetical protein